MNLTYRFKHLQVSDNYKAKQPLVFATLIGNGGMKLNFTAILDTGSDLILLPRAVADNLKLKYNVKKTDSAKTYMGSTFTTTESKVRVQLQKDREKLAFDCICAIIINEEDVEHEYIIFGSSFLEHFRVNFDYPRNKFQILSKK